MNSSTLLRTLVVLAFAALVPGGAQATDIDGPDDCTRVWSDFGDAPEGFDAYPGIPGRFPTCIVASPAGTLTAPCPALGTVPGPTGFVRHVSTAPGGFWLGCGAAAPLGVDSEMDGKTSPGAPVSACADIGLDCLEAAPWGMFGQDECFGSDDAGLVGPTTFTPCTSSALTIKLTSCMPRDVFLNVLADWNGDGDWNDADLCPGGACAPEWVVKNAIVVLPPGCTTFTTPPFLVGPGSAHGGAWLRITVTPGPVGDSFPWAGSAGIAGGYTGGETEDYPVVVAAPEPCDARFEDWGDAPEEIPAYPGRPGHFPTCALDTAPGDMSIDCGTAVSSVPGLTGYIKHVTEAAEPHFWLGCGTPPFPPFGGIDSETNGKTSIEPAFGGFSACDKTLAVDCIQPTPWGIDFGQDECFGDADAGLAAPPSWARCEGQTLEFRAVNCEAEAITVFLNVLVDWTHDGDWNDVSDCLEPYGCAPEWAVKNVPISLDPGCGTYTTPVFRVGTRPGPAWLRISLTGGAANLDYPWAGSATVPGGRFRGGETEDYPVVIVDGPIDAGSGLSGQAWLASPLPNPSGGPMSIRFNLPRAGLVHVGVFDVAGRRVRSLVGESKDAGSHVVRWDGRSDDSRQAPAGVYLIRLETDGQVLTRSAVRLQ